MSALKDKLDPSLDLFADVILNPSFPEADFKRLQKQQLAGIQREKVEPSSMALRVFPRLLYGENHAYSTPLTGSGTEESVAKMTPADMKKFHATWFKPNNATLVVVGDITLAEATGKLEKLFKDWKSGEVPTKNVANVAKKTKSSIYLMDRPGSIQSVIYAGNLAPPKANPDEIAIETMNNILGGTFTSRLNMNLREDKHWSYGARSILPAAKGQRPFIAYAPVQTDKTRESVEEIIKELRGIQGSQPITEAELAKSVANQTLKLPGSWETMGRVAGTIGELLRFGLAEDYWETYPKKVMALKTEDLAQAAKKVINPEQLTWVIVGDLQKIEKEIRGLNLGEVHLLDANGAERK